MKKKVVSATLNPRPYGVGENGGFTLGHPQPKVLFSPIYEPLKAAIYDYQSSVQPLGRP